MSGCCREVLKARWCEPTLSVVDVRIGDEDGSGDSAYRFGPTRFSVIPRSAVGNVSIRFVPDQNADHLIAALRCVCLKCDTCVNCQPLIVVKATYSVVYKQDVYEMNPMEYLQRT